MTRSRIIDLQFANCTSFATMTPLTEAALDWIEQNVSEDAITFGGAIVIEFRYLEDIVLGARADGLVCEG